jgi:hypothetical protein
VAQVNQQRAQEYFKEAQMRCERDGGRLWGVSICAPMVIADRRTQSIATSQPAPAGDRPRMIGFVNAPVQWGGATWAHTCGTTWSTQRRFTAWRSSSTNCSTACSRSSERHLGSAAK